MPVAPKTATTTAPNAAERQSFPDNLVADLRRVRLSNDPTKWEFSGSNPAASATNSCFFTVWSEELEAQLFRSPQMNVEMLFPN